MVKKKGKKKYIRYDGSELLSKKNPRACVQESFNMEDLASELTSWAEYTRSVNFCEFTRPRRLTYRKIKAEAMVNVAVQEALMLVKDALTDNLRTLWLDNPTMKDYVKQYLDCFDEIVQEQKARDREYVRGIIEGHGAKIIHITDSSGYAE